MVHRAGLARTRSGGIVPTGSLRQYQQIEGGHSALVFLAIGVTPLSEVRFLAPIPARHNGTQRCSRPPSVKARNHISSIGDRQVVRAPMDVRPHSATKSK